MKSVAPQNAPDRIRIRALRLSTRVGVPDAERAAPQTVSVNVEIEPDRAFATIGDAIGDTVDYFAVSERLKTVAATGERRLIETLAIDLARAVLEFPRARAVTVEVRKFILPETDYVSVETRLER